MLFQIEKKGITSIIEKEIRISNPSEQRTSATGVSSGVLRGVFMKRSLWILFAVVLGSAAYLYRQRVLLAVGDYLIVQDQLKPVDVIHIIAGDDARITYAVQLYMKGYAKYLFFTGGWCLPEGLNHGAHGQELAIQMGVPIEAIAFDDTTVTSTYSETVRLKVWIDQKSIPIRSVMVVSDPFHMRRAKWTYRQVLEDGTEVIMAPVPFEITPYKRQWWENQYSKDYVKNEYLKSIYYLLRYQFARGIFKEWLASFDQD